MTHWRRGVEWLTRRERRWRRIGLLALIFSLAFLMMVSTWVVSCGFHRCPSAAQIQAFRPSEGSRVLDRSGKLLGRLTYVRRINVPIADVPRSVRAAFIATEDRRFYHHSGIDWRSAGRAFVRNLSAIAIREGFSTITMQVVRNAFLPHLSNERTFRRKLIEIELARRLERTLTKQQILEMYLNVIYLGNGTYGVEAASRDLFGKGVKGLSLAEAATLAGLARGPSLYTPRRHPDRAQARRDLVLSLMAREGYISPELAAGTARESLRISRAEWRPSRDRSYALDPVRGVVDSILGGNAATAGDLVVYSTLDSAAQSAAERAIRIQGAAIQRQGRRPGNDAQLEGAMVALDPRTGEIRALVGGRRSVNGGFNRALGARRQPGSAFKPFVFAAALSAGYSPATILDDSPVEIQDAGRIWRPENFGGEYGGPLTLRRALMRSANAATVRLSQALGEKRVAALARRSGIQSRMDAVPALALGAMEVTPLELVAAYAPFANGGMAVQPTIVSRIESADGSGLWRARGPTNQEQVLDRAEAFQITSMLQSVVDGGTGRVVRNMGVRGPVAGKTGTTNNGADVWFIGYSPTLVAGFWFGYDAPRTIASNASGGRLAAPAWAMFYLEGWHDQSPPGAWSPPPELTQRTIDALNGDLANEWCPETQREWFKSGTEPTGICRTHQAPFIDQLEELGRKIGKVLGRILEGL
jgi:1A family penicillin-binding protein